VTATHPLVERAKALMELGRHEEAGALLAGRVAEDPSDGRAWVHLSLCHRSAKRYDEQLAALDRALALSPDEWDAHYLRAYALRRLTRNDEALAEAHEAIRLEPQGWQGYAALAEALNAWQPRWPQALEAATTAVRLAPEEPGTHAALWKAALINGRSDMARQAVAAALRIDPQDPWALAERARLEAVQAGAAPLGRQGGRLPAVAEAYADALTAAPQDSGLRKALDTTLLRMLHGTRWLGLVCLVMAALAARLFPTGDDPRALPAPLGTRLWALVLMAAVWAFGAWRRYRRLRTGVRASLWSVLRRSRWARTIAAQTVLCTLIAVCVVVVPWTHRYPPGLLFCCALVSTLVVIWYERTAARVARDKAEAALKKAGTVKISG
jgi:tetratricopeptide (TPR) repeat protein